MLLGECHWVIGGNGEMVDLNKGKRFRTPIQSEVRGAGTLARRRNGPGGASYIEWGDL